MAAKKKKTVIVAVRLPEQVLETVDKDILPLVTRENWEGPASTRADAIRYLIRVGLESVAARRSK